MPLNLSAFGFATGQSRAQKSDAFADLKALPGTVVGEVHRGQRAVYAAIERAVSADGEDHDVSLGELAAQCQLTVAAFERHVEALIQKGDVRRNTEGLGRTILVPCRNGS